MHNSDSATSAATEVTNDSPLSQSDADPSLWKTLLGGAISGTLGYLAYRLLQVMVDHFPPIAANAPRLARSISLLVRYLLVGSVALFAFMFGAIAVGLLAYSGQLLIQKRVPPKA